MPDSNSIICTLCEGDYFLGLAALINSLIKSGFNGTLVCGYRNEHEHWQSQWDLAVSQKINLIFEPYETEQHFAQVKPHFLRHVLDKYGTKTTRIFYFDPDIVVECDWFFFEEWADMGVALCEDINSPLLKTDPRRLRWKKIFADKSYQWRNDLETYVNSGFIGLAKQQFGFITEWETTQSHVFSLIPKSAALKHDTPYSLFYSPDQDALNIAVCCSEYRASIMAKESMDFQPGGFIMSHAIGPQKPWRQCFTLESLKGMPPRKCDKLFLSHASAPIPIFNPIRQILNLIDMKLAILISRLIKKS
ncbi:MAG: hypothetical protein K2W82_00050 [Candidatus Obscuribacterales bacterium]|nr:hypothetical protein [Candidatus Obscuribacterales bacterium]